jgi:hypothetical protein
MPKGSIQAELIYGPHRVGPWKTADVATRDRAMLPTEAPSRNWPRFVIEPAHLVSIEPVVSTAGRGAGECQE